MPILHLNGYKFAFHAYPSLIHKLTYRCTNHANIHVRGNEEEGTVTTAFDMTVLNEMGRFHLVMDAIDRLPQTGEQGVYLKQQLKEKLIMLHIVLHSSICCRYLFMSKVITGIRQPLTRSNTRSAMPNIPVITLLFHLHFLQR